MNKNIGFIGCGNMAQAMIEGIINSHLVTSNYVHVSDPDQGKLLRVKNDYGINTYSNNKEVAKKSEVLILAVKPNYCNEIIKEIREYINMDTIIISIAAGKPISYFEREFNKEVKIIRIMPNTPAQVGEGMSVLCYNDNIIETDINVVKLIFSSFSKVEVMEEKYFDGVTAVSGSSPACVYMFIEALADAAVQTGIPRNKAYTMVAQTVLGSAKMVLETGLHPGELKDMVCSPGGTTIEAVSVLEEERFRAAVMLAMKAATNKSKELSNK